MTEIATQALNSALQDVKRLPKLANNKTSFYVPWRSAMRRFIKLSGLEYYLIHGKVPNPAVEYPVSSLVTAQWNRAENALDAAEAAGAAAGANVNRGRGAPGGNRDRGGAPVVAVRPADGAGAGAGAGDDRDAEEQDDVQRQGPAYFDFEAKAGRVNPVDARIFALQRQKVEQDDVVLQECILGYLDDSLKKEVEEKEFECAKDVWDFIAAKFGVTNHHRASALRKEWFRCSKKSTESVAQYIYRLKLLRDELSLVTGAEMSESEFLSKLLASVGLSEISHINARLDLDDLDLETATQLLVGREAQLQAQGAGSSIGARVLYQEDDQEPDAGVSADVGADQRGARGQRGQRFRAPRGREGREGRGGRGGRGGGRGFVRRGGAGGREDRSAGGRESAGQQHGAADGARRLVKCYWCHEMGHHYARNCPVRLGKGREDHARSGVRDPDPKPKGGMHFIADAMGSEMLMMRNSGSVADDVVTDASTFVIDSGSCAHWTNRVDMLREEEILDEPMRVTGWGNGEVVSYKRGTLLLEQNGRRFALKNVYACDEPQNIISSLVLEDLGYEFGPTTAYGTRDMVNNRGNVLFSAARFSGKQYRAKLLIIPPVPREPRSSPDAVLLADARTDDEGMLWHRRLAHASSNVVKSVLVSMGKAIPPSLKKPIICEACFQGKMKRLPFPSKALSEPDGLYRTICCDLIGPISPQSVDGKRFVLHIVDRYSRYTCPFGLTHKSEAGDIIRQYVEYIWVQFKVRVAAIQADGGGEFQNAEMEEFCKQRGIRLLSTPTATSQLNGTVERANGVLMSAVRTLFAASGLPKNYWSYAVHYASYVINRLPHSVTPGRKSPFELVFGKPFDYSRLRAFGCACYPAFPKSGLKKIDYRSGLHRLLSYAEQQHGYAVVPCNAMGYPMGRVIVSRDVHFDETKVFSQPARAVAVEDSHDDSNEADGLDDAVRVDDVAVPSAVGALAAQDEWELVPESSAEAARAPAAVVLDADAAVAHDAVGAAHDVVPPADEPAEVDQPAPEPNNAAAVADHEAKEQNAVHIPRGGGRYNLRSHIQPRQVYGRDAENQDLPSPKEHLILDDERENVYAPDLVLLTRGSSSNTAAGGPQRITIGEALKQPQWRDAIKKELESLNKHGTWVVVRPDSVRAGTTIVDTVWVFAKKLNANGEIVRFKARLCARGFLQTEDTFGETYAPVASASTIRIIFAIAAAFNMPILSLDVSTAYLQAPLKETVFMYGPEGSAVKGQVVQLKRALYGLKQSANAWNSTLCQYLERIGFKASVSDHCLLFRAHQGQRVFIAIYVDDILLCASTEALLKEVADDLTRRFEMSSVSIPTTHLGMEVVVSKDGIKLTQRRQIEKALEALDMGNCKPQATPAAMFRLEPRGSSEEAVPVTLMRSIVGLLNYIAQHTRPDIAFAVSAIAAHVNAPGVRHLQAVKHLLRYLQGTKDLGLIYKRGGGTVLSAIVDADFANEVPGRRSVTGWVIFLAGAPIDWRSRKQATVCLSSTEAEYVAATDACRKIVPLRRLLTEVGVVQREPTVLHEDNQSAIASAQAPAVKPRMKHLDVAHHYIRQCIADESIRLVYIPSQENTADVLTKPIARDQFVFLRKKLGVA